MFLRGRNVRHGFLPFFSDLGYTSAQGPVRSRTNYVLSCRTIALSCKFCAGLDVPDVLRANRTLPVVFRSESVGGGGGLLTSCRQSDRNPRFDLSPSE